MPGKMTTLDETTNANGSTAASNNGAPPGAKSTAAPEPPHSARPIELKMWKVVLHKRKMGTSAMKRLLSPCRDYFVAFARDVVNDLQNSRYKMNVHSSRLTPSERAFIRANGGCAPNDGRIDHTVGFYSSHLLRNPSLDVECLSADDVMWHLIALFYRSIDERLPSALRLHGLESTKQIFERMKYWTERMESGHPPEPHKNALGTAALDRDGHEGTSSVDATDQTKEETGTKWVAHPSLNRSSKDGRPAGEMHTANIITQNVEGYMRVARDPEGDGDFRADHDYTKLEAIVDRMEAKNIGAYCIQETWDYGDEFCKDIGRGYFLWHHNYDERDTREVEGRQVRRGLRRGVAIILNQEFYDAWKEAGSVEPVTSSTRREHGGRVIGITLKFPKIDSRGKKIKDSKGRQGYLNFFLMSVYMPSLEKKLEEGEVQPHGDFIRNELNPILRDAHRDAEIIMGGDINASIGIRVDADEKVLGPNGMDYRCSTVTSRAREDDVLNLLTQQCMRVQNTYFTHDEYATYFDKCDKLPVMYDIFATSQSFHKRVRDCKVVDSGIESDHDAVMISITITTIKYKVKAVTGAQSHGGDYSKTHRTNKCSTDLARKTTTKCATNGQHRNQTKEKPGTKWVVHPSLNRSSKEGRPASGTDLAIEKKSPGIGAQTGNGRQQKAPPRSHDENGTNCLVRHPSPPQSRGDDAVAWSQLVDFEQPNNSTSFALSDFQCGPEANALPDVESLFPSKSDQKSKQFDECEPSRDSPLVPHTSHHSKTEATKNPNKRSQHGKDYKHKVGENPRGSPPDWKKSIPEESVDPISLEPLCELEYPPFAIVADGLPYTPVFPGDWPPADPADETSEEEGRELAILRSQWGEALPKFKSEESGDYKPLTERRFNLFDGQILAFYLVSTLQFIDPYNRRDLTRDELRALDAYLSRHGLKRAGVVEAYDQKGISISTAGARAQTALGRAELLQQNASLIMNSIHSGRSVRATEISRLAARGGKHRATRGKDEAASVMNSLQKMYAQNEPRAEIGGDSGLLIIDDDDAPALRGLSRDEAMKRTTHEQEQHFPSLSRERTSAGRLPATSAPPDFRAVATRGQPGQKPASFVTAEAKRKRELKRQEKEKKDRAFTKLTFL